MIEAETAESVELVDEIADAIRRDVANGSLPIGSRLRQEALASHFGVSRTPIREALRQLHAEGLVVVVPRRGAVVRGPTPREIREAYRVRANLEGLAAELAATWIDDDELRELGDAERRFRELLRGLSKSRARGGDVPRWTAIAWADANDLFHEVIQRAARNETLTRTIVFLHRAIPRGLTGTALAANTRLLQENAREHTAIRVAIEQRDRVRAHVLMRDHISRSGEIAASWFELQRRPRDGR